ncbi:MAG TPA: peptide chain release factor N(5)-glutamine methyltransferase [Alphaproteobacteria bacterium]|nr:peptide chain release factor N(5)-glutamine methyltransferase [Alphaproteobacteria bacterium]
MIRRSGWRPRGWGRKAVPTLKDALREGARRLAEAGAGTPQLDARLLLQAAAGRSMEELLCNPDEELTVCQSAQFDRLIGRRIMREPVSRIVGRREFWSLEFEISPETLDPRADSETLIEAVLGQVADRQRPLRILDIGTGSGCLLLALLTEFPRARGLGLDISEEALGVARRNAVRLGLAGRADFLRCDIRAADWVTQAGGPYDVVISNPPYIPDGEISGLAPEVANFDPGIALAGGEDGLDFYRIITGSVAELLREPGWVALEAGFGQAGAIEGLLRAAGLESLQVRDDMNGLARVVAAQTAPSETLTGRPAGRGSLDCHTDLRNWGI